MSIKRWKLRVFITFLCLKLRRDLLKNPCFYLLIFLYALVGCEKSNEINVDDLNSEKTDFFSRVFEGELSDGPFFLNYWLSTVFLSKDIVSIFGEFTRYTNFPHGNKCYECKTFCRVNGKFKSISFDDLFSAGEQKEFVRKYCEDTLKNGSIGYFGEDSPLRDQLDLNEIRTFLIHEDFLVIVFQRYVVAGLEDYPTTLKIPYNELKDHVNPNIPLISLLEKTVESKSFISSWNDIWGQDYGATVVHREGL
jgi:hypothetical protein